MASNVRVEWSPFLLQKAGGDRHLALKILMREFKRACNEFGVGREIKKREYYRSPAELRKLKQQHARTAARSAERQARRIAALKGGDISCV